MHRCIQTSTGCSLFVSHLRALAYKILNHDFNRDHLCCNAMTLLLRRRVNSSNNILKKNWKTTSQNNLFNFFMADVKEELLLGKENKQNGKSISRSSRWNKVVFLC